MSLLRTLSVEPEGVRKVRSIKFAYNILCPMLVKMYSVDILILVIRDHSLLSRQQLENEAAAVAVKFRGIFRDTTYLSPLGLYNYNGVDKT